MVLKLESWNLVWEYVLGWKRILKGVGLWYLVFGYDVLFNYFDVQYTKKRNEILRLKLEFWSLVYDQ